MDFSQIRIRCSSLGCLFTEPKSAADKKAGNLSKTAQTYLIKTYIETYWGIEKDISTKQMEKGTGCEEDSLTLVSLHDDFFYEKNQLSLSNAYIKGTADIVLEDEVHDIKTSWDAHSFLPKLTEEIDNNYFYQLQGYLWLYGKSKAKLRYCLVDTPETLRNQEKYWLSRRMDVVTEESPDFLREWAKIEKNMIFSGLPVHERVITLEVARDEEVIAQIPQKVEKAREFLQSFHSLHTKGRKLQTA
jgi:hypothetical protein